jgi:hypothetical protein
MRSCRVMFHLSYLIIKYGKIILTNCTTALCVCMIATAITKKKTQQKNNCTISVWTDENPLITHKFLHL